MKTDASQTFLLAAFDLDGTLLGPDGSIGAVNYEALKMLHQRGVEVVLASGRHPLNMRQFTSQLPFVRWVVSAQGGEVSSVTRSERLHNSYLDTAMANRAVGLGLRFGFSPIVYLDGEICTFLDDANSRHYGKLTNASPRVLAPGTLLDGSVFKVLWIGSSEDDCDAAAAKPETATFTWVRTNPRIIEIVPPGVTKGSALAMLVRHLGISSKESVVFGDGENDIPMFAWAATSVAMAHGWPAARKQATFIAPPGPPETALARGIEQLWANTPKR
jgi:Cof subfamily protein (haloacid dehalogenase superfamily)